MTIAVDMGRKATKTNKQNSLAADQNNFLVGVHTRAICTIFFQIRLIVFDKILLKVFLSVAMQT